MKVDERIVRVLSAFDLGSELDKIALRGARYGLPGWVIEQQRKNGSTKTVYLDRRGAHTKAREFLRSAKSAAELAGRQVVLLAMARYADEGAIAHSQRAFYTLTPGDQLPFSGEVIDLVDELARDRRGESWDPPFFLFRRRETEGDVHVWRASRQHQRRERSSKRARARGRRFDRAAAWDLAPQVQAHVGAARRKTGTRSRTHLAVHALRVGLVSCTQSDTESTQ